MQTLWFQHLPRAEQEEFKKLVLGSKKVLDRLKEICYNTTHNEVVTHVVDYESPSWAYKQADRNGYLRAYDEIFKLCDLDKR